MKLKSDKNKICSICGKLENCKEIELFDDCKQELWCEKCEQEMLEDYYKQQEEDLQELYRSIKNGI